MGLLGDVVDTVKKGINTVNKKGIGKMDDFMKYALHAAENTAKGTLDFFTGDWNGTIEEFTGYSLKKKVKILKAAKAQGLLDSQPMPEASTDYLPLLLVAGAAVLVILLLAKRKQSHG